MRRAALLLCCLALASCHRGRRRRTSQLRDPRARHATACIDPRYFASSSLALPSRGTVRDIAVAAGRGARVVAWIDDDGAHRWDLATSHQLRPEVRDLCAWIATPGRRCARADAARVGTRVARIEVVGAPAQRALQVRVSRGGVSGEPQQLSARFDDSSARAILWDGGAFGAAWVEPVHGAAPRAYFALIDREGRRVGSAMRVRTADERGVRRLALAFGGSDYLLGLVFDDGRAGLWSSGPRGCDEPLMAQPPPVPEPAR